MSPLASRRDLPVIDSTATLLEAHRIVKRSGVDIMLQNRFLQRWRASDAQHPITLPQYDATLILIIRLQRALSQQLPSTAGVVDTLWLGMTEDQFAAIGYAGWRDPARAEAVRTIPGVYDNEYKRCQRFHERVLTPMDDTPISADHRHTNATIADAYATNHDQQARTLAETVCNDLVAASIDPDLLTNWQQHLAIDEHEIAVAAFGKGMGAKKHLLHSGNTLAGTTPKHNRLGWCFSIGATFAFAMNTPGLNHPDQCAVVTAFTWDKPSAGSPTAAIAAVDQTIRTLTPPKGKKNRYVITDMAYTRRHGFNAALLQRGYTFVMHYPDDDHPSVTDAWNPGESSGPTLVNGRLACPGLPGHKLRKLNLTELPDNASPRDVRMRARILNYVEPFLMKTTTPIYGPVRRPGQPNNTTNPAGPVMAVTRAECPAHTGRVRCTLVPDSLHLDPATHPDTTPPANPPSCCRHDSTRVYLTPDQFRDYSPLMPGTFEHDDLFRHARARNEGGNGRVVSPHTGNLTDRAITVRRNAITVLVIALAVAATNRRIQLAYREKLRANGGTSPTPNRARLIAQRRALLADLRYNPNDDDPALPDRFDTDWSGTLDLDDLDYVTDLDYVRNVKRTYAWKKDQEEKNRLKTKRKR